MNGPTLLSTTFIFSSQPVLTRQTDKERQTHPHPENTGNFTWHWILYYTICLWYHDFDYDVCTV